MVQSSSLTKGGKTALVRKTRVIDLDDLNGSIRGKGVRLKVEQRCDQLYIRGTFVQADGSSKRQRIPLDLPNVPGSLLEAENRVIQFAALLQQKGIVPDPLPWKDKFEPEHIPAILTVDNAISLLHQDFWKGKQGTSSQRRTWDRLYNEIKKLADFASAEITADLLVAVAEDKTTPATKSRLEICKQFKRLGKLAGLEGLDRLDEIKNGYEPQQREFPDEEQLIELVEQLRSDEKWGWCTAALLLYGCRPSEVFSLQPNKNGTAKVLTLNKAKAIKFRTALALPAELVEPLGIFDVKREWEFLKTEDYDSYEAKRQTDSWGGWLKRNSGHLDLDLYDLRHAWAIRSIRANLQTGLAAKTMGHNIGLHVKTYASALDEADVVAAAKNLIK